MTRRTPGAAVPSIRALREVDAGSRIALLADAGSVRAFPAAGASPHLARFRIDAHDDDGVVIARARLGGEPVFIAAQDERYLAGSVGERHGRALGSMFQAARREHPRAIVLLLASGGVRLHEANAAELALSRALSSLLDARIAKVPVVAIAVGHVFGGASVIACAADRLALLPGTRFGLSGPKVLESVHGKWQLDADHERDVDTVYGAGARTAAGLADLLADDADAVRAWISRAVLEREDFEASVLATHARLARRVGDDVVHASPFDPLPCFDGAAPVDDAGRLWRGPRCWLTPPSPGTTLGPAEFHAVDAALLAHVTGDARSMPATILLVEDCAGHAVSRAAEMKLVSQYLAHHAAVLALLRKRGARIEGLLAGVGHSAAFFVNALQASVLHALASSRVVAMEPSAIARVTGIDAADLIENDPLLGQPIRHFAALGGATIVDDASLEALGI
ncbi:MAG TPA: biotin-independent malonate decarboxylase subunit gamma [Casimicrobiaceae bacterium]|nr:biotin-independent malonate decarboxylase subunit gamma [Casimicrobiaceae bacterium]